MQTPLNPLQRLMVRAACHPPALVSQRKALELPAATCAALKPGQVVQDKQGCPYFVLEATPERLHLALRNGTPALMYEASEELGPFGWAYAAADDLAWVVE